MPFALSKYPTTWVRPPDAPMRVPTPPTSATASAMARRILVLRVFIIDPPAPVAPGPAADRRTHSAPAQVPGPAVSARAPAARPVRWMRCLALGLLPAVPVVGRPAAAPGVPA